MINKQFKTMNIKDLIPYENNPRINDDAVNDVIASIEQCENLDPIEIDEDNVILSGHTRLKALKKLKYKETEVLQITGLTDEQKRKYRILANKTGERAEWDLNKLEIELADLDFEGYDFDFDGVGINYSPDEFTEDFSLPDGDKPETVYLSLTLNIKQKELIEYAISLIGDNVKETFGNTNKAGNAIYEVVRQWAEQKK